MYSIVSVFLFGGLDISRSSSSLTFQSMDTASSITVVVRFVLSITTISGFCAVINLSVRI